MGNESCLVSMPDSLPLYRGIGSGSINFHAERKELRFRRRSRCHRSLLSSLSLFAASASITDELGRFSTEKQEKRTVRARNRDEQHTNERDREREREREIKKQIEEGGWLEEERGAVRSDIRGNEDLGSWWLRVAEATVTRCVGVRLRREERPGQQERPEGQGRMNEAARWRGGGWRRWNEGWRWTLANVPTGGGRGCRKREEKRDRYA